MTSLFRGHEGIISIEYLAQRRPLALQDTMKAWNFERAIQNKRTGSQRTKEWRERSGCSNSSFPVANKEWILVFFLLQQRKDVSEVNEYFSFNLEQRSSVFSLVKHSFFKRLSTYVVSGTIISTPWGTGYEVYWTFGYGIILLLFE